MVVFVAYLVYAVMAPQCMHARGCALFQLLQQGPTKAGRVSLSNTETNTWQGDHTCKNCQWQRWLHAPRTANLGCSRILENSMWHTFVRGMHCSVAGAGVLQQTETKPSGCWAGTCVLGRWSRGNAGLNRHLCVGRVVEGDPVLQVDHRCPDPKHAARAAHALLPPPPLQHPPLVHHLHGAAKIAERHSTERI